jgi:replication-associated recombination protein RarA
VTDDAVGPRRREIPPTARGYPFDEVASALQKCIRRGQEEDAVYWALELDASGYTKYAWRRLLTIVSEDIGLAEPMMPAVIHALHESARTLEAAARGRRGVGRLQLVHAVLLLSRARKSRIVNNALVAIGSDETVRDPPDVAVDRHTKRGRAMGRGYEHFWGQGNWLADPETGELTAEGAIPDPYLERARAVRLGQRKHPEQLTFEESET